MNIARIALIGLGLYRLYKQVSDSVLSKVTWTWGKFSLLKDIKLLKEEITFRLNVTNKNDFSIPITRITGTVTHSGNQIGNISSNQIHELRPGTLTIIEMSMKYISEDLAKQITQVLTGEIDSFAPFGINLMVTATVKGKTITVPVNTTIKPVA